MIWEDVFKEYFKRKCNSIRSKKVCRTSLLLSHSHSLTPLHSLSLRFDWVEYSVLSVTLSLSAGIGRNFLLMVKLPSMTYLLLFTLSSLTATLLSNSWPRLRNYVVMIKVFMFFCLQFGEFSLFLLFLFFFSDLYSFSLFLLYHLALSGIYFWRKGQSSTGEFLLASRQMGSSSSSSSPQLL